MEGISFRAEPRPVVALISEPRLRNVLELLKSVRGAQNLRFITSLPDDEIKTGGKGGSWRVSGVPVDLLMAQVAQAGCHAPQSRGPASTP